MTAVACVAYTRAQGWHLAEVDLDQLLACEMETVAPRRKQTGHAKAPCGTPSAYKRHLKLGEQPCRPCVEAKTEQMRRYRAAKAVAS